MNNRAVFLSLLTLVILTISACQPDPPAEQASNIIESKVNPIDQAVLVYLPAGEIST